MHSGKVFRQCETKHKIRGLHSRNAGVRPRRLRSFSRTKLRNGPFPHKNGHAAHSLTRPLPIRALLGTHCSISYTQQRNPLLLPTRRCRLHCRHTRALKEGWLGSTVQTKISFTRSRSIGAQQTQEPLSCLKETLRKKLGCLSRSFGITQ